MTTVLVALDVPTATGVDAGTPGTLYFTPTRRLNVDGRVVLPAAFSVELVNGSATVELAPNGLDWCWQVQENTRLRHTRYLAVPDSTEPVPYADLVDVDPSTLLPPAAPEAAWWVALDTLDIPGAVDDYLTANPPPSGDGALLTAHINNPNPHPIAHSGRDYAALFQNGLI